MKRTATWHEKSGMGRIDEIDSETVHDTCIIMIWGHIAASRRQITLAWHLARRNKYAPVRFISGLYNQTKYRRDECCNLLDFMTHHLTNGKGKRLYQNLSIVTVEMILLDDARLSLKVDFQAGKKKE